MGTLISVSGSDLPILSVRGHSAEPLEHSHSGLHPPKNCVLVVNEWCRGESEEELRTYGFLDGTHWNDENVRTVGVGASVGHR